MNVMLTFTVTRGQRLVDYLGIGPGSHHTALVDDPEMGRARPLDEQTDARGLARMPPAGYTEGWRLTGEPALDGRSRGTRGPGT